VRRWRGWRGRTEERRKVGERWKVHDRGKKAEVREMRTGERGRIVEIR
jgi:hypothetical protein